MFLLSPTYTYTTKQHCNNIIIIKFNFHLHLFTSNITISAILITLTASLCNKLLVLTTLLDYNTQKELMASFQKVNPMKSAENPERFAKQLQKISTSSSSSHEEPKPWYYIMVMVIYTYTASQLYLFFCTKNQEKNPCEPKEHEFYYFFYESRPPSFGNEQKKM